MNYIKIEKENMINGPGFRNILWLSGCLHKCRECHNPETHDPNFGSEFTDETEKELFSYFNNEYIEGLTLTGGDPLFPGSRSAVLKLLTNFKAKFPDKTVWIWSGYQFEDLIECKVCLEILKLATVLVDGKFSPTQRKMDFIQEDSKEILKYRGSSNQRIIDLKKTLETKTIIEYGGEENGI